jgi:hypothetical protein
MILALLNKYLIINKLFNKKVMDDIESELIETRVQLNHLKLFSKANAVLLQRILERYDGIVEQLFDLNKVLYLQSSKNISFVEPKMNLLFLLTTSIKNKRNNFNKSKFRLLLSVNEDINNYGLYLKEKGKKDIL